jgi:hypothetical protein
LPESLGDIQEEIMKKQALDKQGSMRKSGEDPVTSLKDKILKANKQG